MLKKIKELKLDNRYRAHRINPDFVFAIKISLAEEGVWAISDRIHTIARTTLGDYWYISKEVSGTGKYNQWAHSFSGQTGVFFYFRSQEDWETVKLMYLLKHA